MTLVLASLVVLVGGAAVSAVLVRRPQASLLVGVTALVFGSISSLAAALPRMLATSGDASATLVWPMPLGSAQMALDGLSAWFLASIAIVTLAVAVYSWAYMREDTGHGSVGAFSTFLCLLVAALVLVVTAADAVLFLVGWEAMTLAAFFLVGLHHREAEVRRAAWMYLIATHLGTALCVLPVFGILAVKCGQTGFAAFDAGSASLGGTTGVLVFFLALVGFGTKAGFMPMHVWLPVAHPAAPTPVSALLSAW